MTEKYIATVETGCGGEAVCCLYRKLLEPKKTVGTVEEVAAFVLDSLKLFPEAKYRIYGLEQVGDICGKDLQCKGR